MRRLAGASIELPGDWVDLDLDPATQHRSISRAVRRAIRRDPALAGYRGRLLGLLDNVVRHAGDSGAFFCSSLVLDGDGGPLTATLLMQVVGEPPWELDGRERSRDDVCAGIAAAASFDPDWQDADVDVVALPSTGPAVRLAVLAGGVCVQYIVPVPDETRLLLTFTSPCAWYDTALIELFDAMARTLQLEYCEQPIG